MNILCALGIHKYTKREIHYEDENNPFNPQDGSKAFYACIISHCDRCGKGEIIDETKLTSLHVPTVYLLNNFRKTEI